MHTDRRQFLLAGGALAALPFLAFAAAPSPAAAPGAPAPFLLPPLPPLDHRGGLDIRVWVRSGQTHGAFSSVECAVAPKRMGPPPHLHRELDELMYVVEGTASVLLGREVVEVPAGAWHLRPRGLKHTFWNAADRPLRFFDMYFNQPFEEFLEELFHGLTPDKGYPLDSEKRRGAIARLYEKFGVVQFPESMDEHRAIMARYGLT